MIAVKLDFDDKEFFSFTEKLAPFAIQSAINRAVRKTALWSRTHLLRRIKDEGILRRIIVHRVQLYNKNWRAGIEGGKAVKVWFGINPISADRISRPVKTAKGYRVKKWEFQQAFVPKAGRLAGKLYERTTKNRLPIRRSKVEIDEAGNAAFREVEGLIPARMQELALQELRFEVHKALGNV